jgi:DNA (cytosine-5)-methyltransferase 1
LSRQLTHVDLFSGVGGFTLGFEATGLYETRLLVDSDRAAAATFKRNRPRIPFWPKDLSVVEAEELLGLIKLRPGELDVLTAGPPCQGLSKIGARQLDDDRNKLLKHTCELIEAVKPKLALIENVPPLFWDGQSSLFDELSDMLHEAGYAPNAKVLEAWRYGVPQMRRRLFILAIREDVGDAGDPFPEGDLSPQFKASELIRAADAEDPQCPAGLSVEEAIGDLPSISAGAGAEAMQYPRTVDDELSDYQRARRRGASLLFNHKSRTHSEGMLKKMAMIDEGGRNQELADEHRLRADSEREYFSQAYGRLHRHGIAQTITTYFHNPGSGRFTHYRDLRSITVREAARFQSFDDAFMFTGKSEQQLRHVGNAVPVLLSSALADSCASILSDAGALDFATADAVA